MSARIEAVAAVCSRWPILPKGALRLADDAIRDCLQQAGRRPDELDVVINAGVYREDGLAEPALAAMIQEDIGVSAHRADGAPHATFSFDVANGGAGVLTALEIASGFLDSHTIQSGVVVASDANPGMGAAFPFPSAGGAILLGPAPAGSGFTHFHARAFPEHAGLFESSIQWCEKSGRHWFAPAGENVFVLAEHPEFGRQAITCAVQVARELLELARVRTSEIDLLVAGAYPLQFAAELARALELSVERIAQPEPALRGVHTAGLIGALEPAFRSGRLAAAEHTLLVAAGAGITAAAALYRHPVHSPRG